MFVDTQLASTHIVCKDEVLEITIPWEDTVIKVPINLEKTEGMVIYKVIRELQKELNDLKNKIKDLQKEQKKAVVYEFRSVKDGEARNNIIDYLKGIKKERKQITIFEISQKLRLPADQVEKIMEELEKEEKVKFL